jgi:hypothetical protein
MIPFYLLRIYIYIMKCTSMSNAYLIHKLNLIELDVNSYVEYYVHSNKFIKTHTTTKFSLFHINSIIVHLNSY